MESTVVEGASRARGLTVGICLRRDHPEPDPRIVVEHGGHPIVFARESLEEAIEACQEHRPDLFLLCVRRPDGDSIAALAAATAASPKTRPILVCERAGEREVRRALDAGARGLVMADRVGAALLPAIEAVRVDQVCVPSSAGGGANRNVLTAREKQILGLVVLGMSNGEIAARLFLAESTVKSHLSSAFAKLGVSSRNEAAALILDPATGVGLGILTIPSEKVTLRR